MDSIPRISIRRIQLRLKKQISYLWWAVYAVCAVTLLPALIHLYMLYMYEPVQLRDLKALNGVMATELAAVRAELADVKSELAKPGEAKKK